MKRAIYALLLVVFVASFGLALTPAEAEAKVNYCTWECRDGFLVECCWVWQPMIGGYVYIEYPTQTPCDW